MNVELLHKTNHNLKNVISPISLLEEDQNKLKLALHNALRGISANLLNQPPIFDDTTYRRFTDDLYEYLFIADLNPNESAYYGRTRNSREIIVLNKNLLNDNSEDSALELQAILAHEILHRLSDRYKNNLLGFILDYKTKQGLFLTEGFTEFYALYANFPNWAIRYVQDSLADHEKSFIDYYIQSSFYEPYLAVAAAISFLKIKYLIERGIPIPKAPFFDAYFYSNFDMFKAQLQSTLRYFGYLDTDNFIGKIMSMETADDAECVLDELEQIFEGGYKSNTLH